MSRSALVVVLAVTLAASGCMPPSWGAAALLHPMRRSVAVPKPADAEAVGLDGDGLRLQGWRFRPQGSGRGTVILLHGSADNRASGVGVARHFSARGFTVVSYDSRAHGDSQGDACTYGFYEKRDLSKILDVVGEPPIIVMGTSLGAAVALQAAADDQRITGVIAVATFSDLRTVVTERAPFFATRREIDRAFQIAEERARFDVSAVSPVAAARRIVVPVMLIHGAQDGETPPDHSRRVYAALRGPKQLLIVPGRRHNDALTSDTWREIDRWVELAVRR
jgi:pimeloyl-ACP methyl ester carboxylesterase